MQTLQNQNSHCNYLGRIVLFCLLVSLTIIFLHNVAISLSAGPAKSVTISGMRASLADTVILDHRVPVERQMAGGERHFYRIHLDSGQYLHLVVEQKGIDVMVKVFGPEGGQLLEVDSPNGTQGPEPVSLVADTSGNFRVEVSALETDAAPGEYEIKVVELREVREEDRWRMAAEQAYAEAKKFSLVRSREGHLKTLQQFDEAASWWQKMPDSLKVAETFIEAGILCYHRGDLHRAVRYFSQCLPIWKNLGRKTEESDALNALGLTYGRIGKSDSGFVYLHEALELRQQLGDSARMAAVLNNLGMAYSGVSEFRSALDYYHQTLPYVEASGDSSRLGRLLDNMAGDYRRLGQIRTALRFYQRALEIKQAIKDSTYLPMTLNNFGTFLAELGDTKQGLDYLNRALALVRLLHNPQSEAATLNNIGNVYSQFGEKEKAHYYYKQSLDIRIELKDTPGIANSWTNIGGIYDARGEYQKSLDYYYRALKIWRQIKNKSEEAITLNNIAGTYGALGDLPLQLDFLQKALAIHLATGNKGEEASTLMNIGNTLRQIGSYDAARDSLERSLELTRQVKNEYREPIVLANIGVYYSSIADYQQALAYFEQAKKKYEETKNLKGRVVALGNMGNVYEKMNDTQKAFEHLHQALALNDSLGDKSDEARLLYDLARNEAKAGNLHAARMHVDSSLSLVEALRNSVGSPALRASYFAAQQQKYRFMCGLLLRLHEREHGKGFDSDAFAAIERSRARGLQEILTEDNVDIHRGVDSKLVEDERALQNRINAQSNILAQLRRRDQTQPYAEKLQKEIDSLFVKLQFVQGQIRAASPHYAALTQPQPLDAEQIQQQVLDDETMLLEYALGEERSYLFAVTPDTLHVFTLPRRAEIDSLAKHVYGLLIERNNTVEGETRRQAFARAEKADAMFWEPAAALSQMILAPAADLLANKRLFVVADGGLQYIPFAALPDPRAPADEDAAPSPLVLANEIVSLPSASVLALLREQFGDRPPAPKCLAMFADPVYETDDPRLKQPELLAANEPDSHATRSKTIAPSHIETEDSITIADVFIERATRGVDFDRLLHSGREASAIIKVAPQCDYLLATGFDAGHDRVLSEDLSRYRIVHFAMHGLLNSEQPELSGLVLSLVDSLGNPLNGFLRLNEIYNLSLNAELVVLSACETAMGKEIRGEGLISLVRGFMYAGAPRVIASLWQVNDESTAELMQRFYHKMLGEEELRPAAALRAAQIEMWQIARWQSPYYWAAFVLQGEWR